MDRTDENSRTSDMPINLPFYAHAYEDDGAVHFEHLYPSRQLVELCGGGRPVRVVVTEDENGAYWGWRSADGRISMVYPSREQVEVCFPYGTQVQEERGIGRVVRLDVQADEPLADVDDHYAGDDDMPAGQPLRRPFRSNGRANAGVER